MRRLLGHRAWRIWASASFLARLPTSMSLLAFQLAGVYAVHSIAHGAELAGVAAFTAGFVGPLRGAWLDRREMRSGLQISCCAAAIFMGLFATAVGLRASFPVLLVLAIGLGLSVGGIWGGFRALLLCSVPENLLRRAHFVESLSTEVGYGLGPLLVTGIALVAGVITALVVMTVVFVGAALMLRGVATLPPTPKDDRNAGRLTGPIVFICAVGALQSFGFGIVEGNVPARMKELGFDPDASGIFLALLSVGSVVGGVVVSAVPISSRRPALLGGALFLLFGLLVLPSTFATSGLTFGATLLFASLMLVPLSGLGAAEIEARVGEKGRGRVFALFLGAVQVGGGVGVAANGALQAYQSPHQIPWVSVGVFALLGILLLGVGLRIAPDAVEATASPFAPSHDKRSADASSSVSAVFDEAGALEQAGGEGNHSVG